MTRETSKIENASYSKTNEWFDKQKESNIRCREVEGTERPTSTPKSFSPTRRKKSSSSQPEAPFRSPTAAHLCPGCNSSPQHRNRRNSRESYIMDVQEAPTQPTTSPPPKSKVDIHTYHCLCHQLVLASTTPISALPRRSGLDQAYILPLPPLPRSTSSTTPAAENEKTVSNANPTPDAQKEEDETKTEKDQDENGVTDLSLEEPSNSDSTSTSKLTHFALLLRPSIDRTPRIVQREDGFEKRWMVRCERCKLGIGYQLDRAQYLEDGRGASKEEDEEEGRREDVVYILPKGLRSTVEMREAKLK
ncbi:hypothetical protein K402DRAFT_403531 [Aulographum hederae CBS 113979]|uniref:STEEP1 domain-containing protein n=1 Tax=Aulographum hederae CBS 113979 TaxID=1176131 RepID=A0A6G1H2F4_9PEZI|nr:hypothetical protein K402DRAFT_403531 [Aulographum hederae CBS 113979]